MWQQALMVDLYELTMAAGYHTQGYNPQVCFELFVRELPVRRNFLVAAGLEQAVNYLKNLRFTGEQIEYLKGLDNFKTIGNEFFDYLQQFRFSGSLHAVAEGTVVGAGQPIVQIEAPLIEAQIVETFLLSTINFQTLVASKAARVVQAAQTDGIPRGVMEFGSRRAHGPEAAVLAARAAYLAGFVGTSNVEAGYRFGIPVLGTTAHSWTMAFQDEQEAFKNYLQIFGTGATFLIDTYNTKQGAKNAMAVAKEFKAVRIDSGNLETEAKGVRTLLDENGYSNVKIILSSDLNEYKIQSLIENGTPVDLFGVGTQVAVSYDAPALQGVYKLVEIKEQATVQYRAKYSPNKMTLPGRKQIWRYLDGREKISHDTLALIHEDYSSEAKALIKTYIRSGKVTSEAVGLSAARENWLKQFKSLPDNVLNLTQKARWPVKLSPGLDSLSKRVAKEMEKLVRLPSS